MMIRTTLLLTLLVTPALAQTATVDRLSVGGIGNNTVTVIGRADYPITMQVMRFNDGADTGRVHEMNMRVYCLDGTEDTGITSCLSTELDTWSESNNGSSALNITPTKRSTGSIRAFHATTRDFSPYTAAESEGVFVAETGIMTIGPEDYAHHWLGKRQGVRFVGKSRCGDNREGTVPPCEDGAGFTEIGTGFVTMTNQQYPTVTIGQAFAAAEVGGGRIERGFRCEISGTCLVVEGNPEWAARLNGADVELRDGVTLLGELGRLQRRLTRLQRRVKELEGQ